MIAKRSRLTRSVTAVVVLVGFAGLTGVVGCGGGSGPTAIKIQGPASANVDPGDSATFSATVASDTNNAGVTWTLTGTGCSGAACGTLSGMSTTGVAYTAPANVTTAFTVTITATSVAKTSVTGTVSISVPVNLGITTAAGALGGGTVGVAYSVTLTQTGGVSPYTWTVTTGALPAGLSLNASTGTITGTPTAAGSPNFTVTLTDSGSPALTTTVKLSISIASPPAIVFSTKSLAGGTVGTAYSAAVAATGGAGTLTYALGSGSLPAGLSLSSAGAITGTPTKSGSSTVIVKATDAYGDTGTSVSLSIAIAAAPAIVFSTTSLAGGTVGTAYSAAVTATGGAGTLTYALASGSLPAGLSLSSAGAITGKPAAAGTGTFAVKATDAYGDTDTSGSLSIAVVYPALTITPATLANGTVGTAYSATLSASGGSGSGYSFTVTSGTGLSAVGLSLSTGGVVSGTPSAAETAGTFVVKVTDGVGNTASATITLTVAYSPLSITTASLPAGIVGGAYSVQLASSGGSGMGYAYTVSTGTGLSAAGLTLSSGGLISGAPTAAESAGSVTVKVTDSASNTATATFSVKIYAALTITPATLANGTVGTSYSATLSVSGGSGSGYSFVVSSGTGLTAVGLSLSTGGVVSGIPSAAETAGTFVVKVTDGVGDTGTTTVTLTVVYPALTITTTSLANGSAGVAYSQTLGASGGSGKGFTWTVTSGSSSLSAVGLSVSSGGVVSGTTPTAGTANFTVKVTDSAGNTATVSLSVTVSAGLTVTTTSLPNGTVGAAYSATLGASGGTGMGYTWTVTSGAGLSAVGLSLGTGGVISGTPTAAEAATQFTVKVTDSGGNTATATLALIVNNAPLSITTTSIPGATANVAYSETFSASGGSGNYSWSVTSGLGELTGETLAFTTGGVLSGTPTTVEQVTFTVQVTDTTTNATASTSFTLDVSSAALASCTHDGSGNALLNGNYAFGLSGFDPNGHFYDEIGDFAADGSGAISGGNGDVNGDQNISNFASGEVQYTFTGTYSIGSTDDRGIMTLTNTNSGTPGTELPSSTSYCFVADSVTGGVAQTGHIIQADGSGFVLTGDFTIQSTSDFTLAALNGNYVFGMQGVDGTGDNRRGFIGLVALDGSGNVTSGQFDHSSVNYNGVTYSNSYSAANAITSSGSSYTVGTNGRGTLTLNAGSGNVLSFVTYVYGTGNQFRVLTANASSASTTPLLEGSAHKQSTTSYTTANVEGTSVLSSDGTTDPSVSPLRDRVTVGQLSLDGSGNATETQDKNSGGTLTGPTVDTAGYTVTSAGYLTITGGTGPFFYLYAPGAGFGLDEETSVNFYRLVSQTVPSGGFTSSDLNGSYGLGTISPAAYNGIPVSGGIKAYPQVADGTSTFTSGSATLTQDSDTAPGLAADIQVDQTDTNSWALDSTYGATTGRFTVTGGGGGTIAGYLVSPTQAFLFQVNGTNGSTMPIEADHQ